MKNQLTIFLLLLLTAPLQAQHYASDDTTTVYPTHGTVYANMFVGRKTASGEVFTQDRYTAAHWKIKFGTLVLVTNPDNGRQVIVKVNDRCPKRGVIDLSRKAATAVGIKGSRKVTIQILPERYRSAWENQPTLDGFANTPHDTIIAPNATPYKQKTTPPKSKAPAPASNSQKSNTKAASKTPTLYDLDLCTVKSVKSAQYEISRLPILYQDKVEIITCKSNQVLVRLKIGQSYKKVVETQKKLANIFPKSIPHKIAY